MRIILLLILMIASSSVWGEGLFLKTQVLAQGIEKPVEIGSINVPSLGKVRFTAERNGIQVLVHATGPDGDFLGKAETIVGLSSVPIHIATPNGLTKIEIFWNLSGAKKYKKDLTK